MSTCIFSSLLCKFFLLSREYLSIERICLIIKTSSVISFDIHSLIDLGMFDLVVQGWIQGRGPGGLPPLIFWPKNWGGDTPPPPPHLKVWIGLCCNIVKGEKKKVDGWAKCVAIKQVFCSLVMDWEAEQKQVTYCVAVKQNTVQSRFTDTSLTPMCCNKPFLLEGKKSLSWQHVDVPSTTVHQIGWFVDVNF